MKRVTSLFLTTLLATILLGSFVHPFAASPPSSSHDRGKNTSLPSDKRGKVSSSEGPKHPSRTGHHTSLVVIGDTRLVVEKLPFTITCTEEANFYNWEIPSGWKGRNLKNSYEITSGTGKGTVTLVATKILWEKKDTETKVHSIDIIIGYTPAPVPPPDPGPLPPDPGPTPGPTPAPVIPGPGFKVLILYESKETGKMPGTQKNILTSTKDIFPYLNAKTANDPDVSGWKAWRIWDQNVLETAQGKNVGKMWRDAVMRARSHKAFQTPWIMISTDKTGFEGPLPLTVDETLALLRKYGG